MKKYKNYLIIMDLLVIFILAIGAVFLFSKCRKENYADQIAHAYAGNIAGPMISLPYDIYAVPAYKSIRPSSENLRSKFWRGDVSEGPSFSGPIDTKENYRNFGLPFECSQDKIFPFPPKRRCEKGCPAECPYGCPTSCPYDCPGSSFDAESPVNLWGVVDPSPDRMRGHRSTWYPKKGMTMGLSKIRI